MAANLSVEIGLTGNAAQQAQQITQAFKDMGAAGDKAAVSVKSLQEAASKPMGTPSVNSFSQLVASLEQARQLFAQMTAEGAGMASLGGPMASSFQAAAAGAEEVTAALKGALDIAKDMISEGASMEKVYAMLNEQIMQLPTGMEKLGAEGRAAFETIRTMAQEVVTETKEWDNLNKQVAKDISDAAQQYQRAEAAEAKANAQAERGLNIRRMSRQEESRTPLAGAISTVTNLGMGAQMMTQGGLLGPAMGIQMLATGMNEAGMGAQAFGAGFTALIPTLIAGAAAIAAVGAALKVMQESLKAAAEEQTLETRLKAVTGSASTASTEMQSMKDFVTGGAGGFLALPDVAAGTAALQNLIGPAAANNQIMEGIAGSAAKANKSYQEMADQIGAVIAKMKEGAPIRETGLIQLQKEGVLTDQDVESISKAIKAHGDAATAIQLVINRLHENASAATEMTGTWKGLWQQLSNVVNIDVFAPIGQKLIAAFTPAIKTVTAQLVNLGQDVVTGLETGNFAPAIENLISTAFSDGWKTAVALIKDGIPTLTNTFVSLFQDAFQKLVDPLKNAMTSAFDAVANHVGDDAYWTELNHAIARAIENGVSAGFAAVANLAQVWWQSIIAGPPSQAELDALNKRFGVGGTKPEVGPENVGVLPKPEELPKLDVTGQLGGPAKVKEAKDQFKELTDAIKAVTDAEKLATNEVRLYDAETKAGMITADQAAQKKQQAYTDEYQKLQQSSAVLQDLITKYSAMGDKGKEAVQKATDALEELRIKQADILAQLQELGTGTFFQNFVQGIKSATAAWGTFGQQTIQLGKQITDQLASGIGNALTGLETGTMKVGDAFKNMAIAIIQAINEVIAKQLVMLALNSLIGAFTGSTGGAASSVAGVASGIGSSAAAPAIPTNLGSTPSAISVGNSLAVGAQTGGLVYGPGGIDKVPSALTAGEYVLTQRAVAKYGLAMIDSMNQGTWQKFAGGGFVGSATSPNNIPPAQSIAGGGGSQNIAIVTNVTVPGTAGQSAAGSPVGGASSQSGLTPQNAALLQQSISLVVRDEIVRQKRPGGLLSKQAMTV